MNKDETAYVESRLWLDENNHVVVQGKAYICIDVDGEPPKSMHIDDLIEHLTRGVYEKKKYDLIMAAELQEQSLNELIALKNGTEPPKFSLAKSMAAIDALPRRSRS